VRLASQLTGWDIDILTERKNPSAARRNSPRAHRTLHQGAGRGRNVRQLLASEGFETVEEIAYVDSIELASIEGLNDEIAEELQARAQEYLDKLAAELEAKRVELGVADDLKSVAGLTGPMLVTLGEKGVKTLEDFAGLVGDDIRGYFETKNGERVREPGVLEQYALTAEQADQLVISARVAAGWIEAPPEPEPEAEPEGDADDVARVFPDRG
jgi:N utilization substance protein A